MTQHISAIALSDKDRAKLSPQEEETLLLCMRRGDMDARRTLIDRLRRQAAQGALRYHGPHLAYDLYLAGLMCIEPFLRTYPGGDTMGMAHAFSWPLRNAQTRAYVALCHCSPAKPLPFPQLYTTEAPHA